MITVLWFGVLHSCLAFFTDFAVLPRNITRLGFPAQFDCQTAPRIGFSHWAVGPDNAMLSESNCPGCTLQANSSLYFPTVTLAHDNVYTCFIILLSGTAQPRVSVYLTVVGVAG